jgi:uncharacterized YccA/Bax inhibitor family protein
MSRGDAMPLWQRSLITLMAMLLTSFVAAILWHNVFNVDMPSYLSGVVGGVTAVPIREFLKRVGPLSSRGIKYLNRLSVIR